VAVPIVSRRVGSPDREGQSAAYGRETTDGFRYGAFAPRAPWDGWIARLWVQEAPAVESPPTTVVPNGQVELIVRFGDPFVHLAGGRAVPVPAVAALGARTRPIAVAATGSTGLVIAGLHPWVGDALLGGLTAVLADRTVDLADLLGASRVASLLDQVSSAPEAEARARAVETFLAGLFRRHTLEPMAVAATRTLLERRGRVSVGGVAGELGLSDRHLRRLVTRATGLGPKRLARLARAQGALSDLRAGRAGAPVAQAWGYVDQAHLTREIRMFSGRTPGMVHRDRSETLLMSSFNNRGPGPSSGTVYL
jgi:AraC-like DNA-binding protein